MTEGSLVVPWAGSSGNWLQKGMRDHSEVMKMLYNLTMVEVAHFSKCMEQYN